MNKQMSKKKEEMYKEYDLDTLIRDVMHISGLDPNATINNSVYNKLSRRIEKELTTQRKEVIDIIKNMEGSDDTRHFQAGEESMKSRTIDRISELKDNDK